jgi:Transposase
MRMVKEGKWELGQKTKCWAGAPVCGVGGDRLGGSKTCRCLQAAGTTQRESGEVEHTPEAVEAWVGELCQRFGNRPIAVAVEQTKGALVFMLSKYEPLHLFPVPPAMSAKMRAALYPSGAKDDPRDADLRVDLLLQHHDKLRRLSPDSEATRRVQNLVEERRHLVEEKTAQSNRLTNHLKIYFP